MSNVHVQSYRGDEKSLSTLKRTDDGRPLMQPGATYTFVMNVTADDARNVTTSGTWTPRRLDVIEFDSVRWADGTHHGTAPFPQAEPEVEARAGRQLQLRRIVAALRQTLAEPESGVALVTAASNRIRSLPDAEPEQLDAAKAAMRRARSAALADLARLAHDDMTAPDGAAITRRLTSMVVRYEDWLARLSPP